jgi:hypothetical protein
MLQDAETHREVITTALLRERTGRDDLRTELRRITAELQVRIAEHGATIRDLVSDLEEAEALVKSLTLRTRKPSAAVQHDPDHRAAAAVSADVPVITAADRDAGRARDGIPGTSA